MLELRGVSKRYHDGESELRVLEGVDLEQLNLCRLGSMSMALSRNIYDDNAHDHCSQDEEQYEQAYTKLEIARWPEPKLDIGALGTVAEQYADDYEVDIGPVPRGQWHEIFEDFSHMEGDIKEIERLLRDYRDGGGGALIDSSDWNVMMEEANLEGSNDAAFEDFVTEAEQYAEEQLWEALMSSLNENPTYVVAYYFDPEKGVDQEGEELSPSEIHSWDQTDGHFYFPLAPEGHIDFERGKLDLTTVNDSIGNDIEELLPDVDFQSVTVIAVVPGDIYDRETSTLDFYEAGCFEVPAGRYDWSNWDIGEEE